MSDSDTFVQDPVVAEYYRSGLLKELVERHGLQQKETPTNNAATFAAYYGFKAFPAELEQFLRMRDEYEFVHQSLGEWRIFGDDVWLPDPAKGNLAEQVIALDQNNYLGTCILEYSAGCVFLGTAGNGDAYFACSAPEGSNAEVLYWNHETNDLEFSIADSLSSLAYANHLLAKAQNSEDDDEEASLGNIAEAFARIKDRVSLSWHYSSLEEVAEAESSFKGGSHARYYFYRSLWINYLLRNDDVHKMRAVSEVFAIVDQGQLSVDRAIESPWLAVLPQTAFYWLWRLFFFNKEEKLRQVIEITRSSGNPFVRDLALLVEELQNGRKELGSIADIHALREAFIARDLDPDRAEERKREQEEAERLAARQKAADERRAAEMLATLDNAALVELAWENVGNATILKPIYERLRASEPALSADFIRADFYFNDGHCRDNCIYSSERDDVLEALGRNGDVRLAPMLLNRGGYPLLPVAAQMGDERVFDSIASALDERSEYNHALVSAVQAAGVLRAKPLADKLIAMIAEFAYPESDFHGSIKNKALLWALFEALAAIGERRAVEPIVRIAASNHKDLTARAIASLGRLGDPAAVDGLLPALSGRYGRPAMFALARIGDARALEPMTALVEKRRGLAEKLVYERVMLDALRSRCGQPVALDNARFALKCVEGNKFEDVELHETAIDLLARRLDSEALSGLLAPFYDAEREQIRHAARKVLGTGGAPAPVNFYDRATADAIFAERGVEGLRAALRDPRGALLHNVVRKAIDENLGAELEEDLIAYGRELLSYEHGTCGYSDGWKRKMDALAHIGKMGGEAADSLAYDALTHPNYMMRRPFEYQSNEVKERVRRFGPMEIRRPGPDQSKARLLEVERLGQARWSLGAMVNGVAFTPDGERLIATGGQGGAGGAAIVFDRNGDEIRSLSEVRGWSYDVDIHPDGKLAAFGLHAGHLLLVDLDSGELLADLRGHGGVPDGVRKVRFSPDGTLLASASDDESVIIWDVASRKALRRVHDKFDVNTVDWFPDGRRVVFGTDKQIGIIDVSDESAEIRRLDTGGLAEVRVFANGTRIAAGGSTRKGIVILNEALEILQTFDQRDVARIRFSKDENQMFAVSWEGERLVRRWDMASGEAVDLEGHDDAALFALDLDPRTGAPFAGGKRNVVMSWDVDCALREAGAAGHGGEVARIVPCGPDEIISVAEDGSTIRWSLTTGQALTRYKAAEPMRASAVALSPGRAIVLVTGFDGAVAFRVSNGAELWRRNELERSEIAMGLPDHFVVGSDRELVWLDFKTGEIVHRETVDDGSWLEHLLPVADPSPIANRQAFVAAYRAPRLRLLDFTERRCVGTVQLPVRADKAETYGIGLGGGKLVVSRWDASFDVVDAATLQHRFQAHELYSFAPVAVSPDGALVACGEGELRLFDAESFDLAALQPLGHKITALAFVGPRHLVAGLGNGQLVSVKISEAPNQGPELPRGLPEDAFYERKKDGEAYWVVGQNEGGVKQGVVRQYREDGSLHDEAVYVDGVLHGPYRAFYENGEVFQVGAYREGKFDGPWIWTRCTGPTREKHAIGADFHSDVWTLTKTYDRGVAPFNLLCYSRDGVEVDQTDGKPVAPRPEGVPAHAFLNKPHDCWVSGFVANPSNEESHRIGVWTWWTLDGELSAREVYSDKGLLLEKCTEFELGDFSQKRTYAYDSEGRMIEDRDQRSSLCFLHRYAYTPEKQETLKATFSKDGALRKSVEREYDDKTITSEIYKGEAGALKSKGVLNGEGMAYEFFHDNGVKAASGDVKDKRAVGVWRFYDESGNLTHQMDLTPFHLRCRVDEDFHPAGVLGDALIRQIDMSAPLPPQLAGVDDVNWSEIQGGYGGPGNFPRLLRALASPEEAAREAALGGIYMDAFFHNTVWNSAAYVMPFLIRLLEHPNADQKDLLEFIHELAEAAAPYVAEAKKAREHASGEADDDVDVEVDVIEVDDDVEEDGEGDGDGDGDGGDDWWFPILSVMDCVAEGWPILQKFAESEDPELRKAAVSLAQYANTRHATKSTLLETARSHRASQERAVAVNGLLSLPDASLPDALEFMDDRELLVSTAAALVAASKWGPECPPRVVEVLMKAFAEREVLCGRYEALPIARSDMRTELALSLGSVRNDAAQAFLPTLCAEFDRIALLHAWDYGRGLLALALGRGDLPFAKDFLLVLETISRSKEFFTWVNGSEVLRDWALPTTIKEYQKLMADIRNAKNPEQALHDFMHRPR